MSGFRVLAGSCRPLFVFEVGLSIDLDAAAGRVQAAAARQIFRHRSLTPQPFEPRSAPLRISADFGDAVIPPFRFGSAVELVLYDFGAALVSYTLPLPGSAAEILELSIGLRGHQGLLADARRRVTELVQTLGPAIQRPRVAELVEDYFVFQIEAFEGPADAAAMCAEHAEAIARVLRAETTDLSPDEIADAIEARISFGRMDVTIVDWDSAFIIDREPDLLREVLEFANVQLLELRYLDHQVDQILERSYLLPSRPAGWRSIVPSSLAPDLREVSGLQVEAAILLERVTNALKFLGEEYLARVYRLVAGRLHLAEWDSNITRKLATIESIYQKMADRSAGRRMELLEWVVILLIALELVVSLRG